MITAENITKSYGKRQILRDISFIGSPGEQIAIIGRNGCGKTTLMKILAGIQKPDAGTLSYFGKDPIGGARNVRKLCGYVPQENPLMEELSVRDNLRLWGGSQCLQDQRLREMFDLDDIMKMQVRRLSGGMKRRVSIACAICQWPPILLMDEPTNSVDLYYKKVIHQWMKDYLGMNGIIVLSTHDQQEIADSSRCLLMKDGVLQELSGEERSLPQIHNMIEKGRRYGNEI